MSSGSSASGSGSDASHRPRVRASLNVTTVAVVVAMVVAIAVAAALAGVTAGLIALGALLVIVALCAGVYTMLARNATENDPAARQDPEPRGEPMPGSPGDAQGDVALGDTAEAHDEINPHDLPPDHPGRRAAAEQAGGEHNTTRGDTDLTEAAPSRTRGGGEPG